MTLAQSPELVSRSPELAEVSWVVLGYCGGPFSTILGPHFLKPGWVIWGGGGTCLDSQGSQGSRGVNGHTRGSPGGKDHSVGFLVRQKGNTTKCLSSGTTQ